MSEQNKPTEQNDEVDLGQLFRLIGELFNGLFDFLGNVFHSLFKAFIYSLKPFVENIKFIVIVLAVSAIAGFLWEKNKSTVYTSDILVRPYFDSKYQLADNIDYFNALISEKNHLELSNIFEIDSLATTKLLGFEIEIGPQTKNDLIQEYNAFIKTIDSTIASTISFDDFLKNRDILNGTTFVITAESYQRDVFKNLENGLIKTFKNNYSKKNKRIRDSSIVIERGKLMRDLKKVDSIQKIYLEVLKTDAEKQTGVLPTVAFPLAQEKTQTKEYELLQEEIKIREQLKALDERQIVESEFYDVLASFEEVGTEKKLKFLEKYKFVFPIVTSVLMILMFTSYKFFIFVKNYE